MSENQHTGVDPRRPVRPLHISTQDLQGGAFRASYRLHRGLLSIGTDSRMLVQGKLGEDPTVHQPGGRCGHHLHRLRRRLARLPLALYPNRTTSQFTAGWVPFSAAGRASGYSPDIVNLHWVARGGASLGDIGELDVPIVWTMHDMWPFTGGCHYSGGCDAYRDRCGSCPQLGSERQRDLSRLVWHRKNTRWSDSDITLVAPSRWLANRAGESSLFGDARIEVVPYGLDTDVFRPWNRGDARRAIGLPPDAPLVLFGAFRSTSNRRKGFHLLKPALERLVREEPEVELVVFGAEEPADPPRLGAPVHYLGVIDDDELLSAAYAAADLFVAPSLEDNLPNTVLEATACGTATVAFRIGGMPDMVLHRETGYLAEPYESDDLCRGMAWALAERSRARALGRRARERAEREYGLARQAERYRELYADILDRAPARRSIG